jgi:hypothetical protein
MEKLNEGHKLVNFIRMDSRVFNSLEKNVREQNWWKVLSIDQPSSFVDKNHVKSLDTLVSVYRLSKWLECSDSVWLRKLIIDGQVICSACFKKDSILGAMACRKDYIQRHLDTEKHKKNVEDYDTSQPKIDKTIGGAVIGGSTYEVVDAIEIDDDKLVAQGKGRKKRLRRLGEDVNSDEERKKERLERIAKTNEMWDALKIKEKEEEERRKKEREGRKTEK